MVVKIFSVFIRQEKLFPDYGDFISAEEIEPEKQPSYLLENTFSIFKGRRDNLNVAKHFLKGRYNEKAFYATIVDAHSKTMPLIYQQYKNTRLKLKSNEYGLFFVAF